MAIYKSKHASNFTVVPNDIFKSGVPIQSIGLLVYLLSLPHDWVIHKTNLHHQLNMGREKLDSMFKDLQKHGYIVSVKHQTKDGVRYEHIVYDKPFNGEKEIEGNNQPTATPLTESPLTESPLTGNPSTGNPQLLNIYIQKKQIQKKEHKSSEFEKFWDLYEKKVGDKEKIRKKWELLAEKDIEKIFWHVPLYKKTTPDKKFRKDPSTYINNKAWNDEIIGHKEQKKDSNELEARILANLEKQLQNGN
jgi:hypothetical protein